MGRLQGKTVLVTGSGSGIGRAAALRAAAEGASLVLLSRTAKNLEETASLVVSAGAAQPRRVLVDQSSRASVDAACAEIIRAITRLDAAVHAAGVDDPEETPLALLDDETWDHTLEVNLTSVFRITRALLPLFPEGGAMVFVGSANSIVPRSNASAYCASKAGLLHLTRSLALEMAPRKIRVNCVCPGVVDTPLTDLFLQRSDDPAALREAYARSNPLKRMATADEIAGCIQFLLSDDAAFVTGTSLVADGGMLAGS
jgi:NAD(P)-dependent dehydrogenase (short-subunit alcohol dehydrogenase family)